MEARNGATPDARGWGPALAAAGVAVVSAAIAWRFTCDDAAITFRFAEQAAAGNPLGTVAPGDPLVSGFSNPTWTLLLTAAARLGLAVTGTAKVLGALCFALTAALATRLIQRLVPRASLAWVGVAVGASCTVATWAVSGLENPLVGLLVVAAALLLVAEEQEGRTGWRGLGSSAAVAALVISRPDAFTYLAAAALARGLATRRRMGPALRPVATDLVRWLAAPSTALVGWTLFSIRRFGYPLANTVYAKVQVTVGERVSRMTDLGSGPLHETIQFTLVTATLLIVPLAIIGCWRRGTPATTVALLTAATFVLPLSEADWMADYRFYAVSVPLLIVLAAVGLDATARWSDARRDAAPAGSGSPLLTPVRFGAAFVVLWSLVNVSLTVQRANDDFANQVTVSGVRGATLPLDRAGERWGLSDPLVMTADAGATVDDLDLRILDLAGLLDPQIGHLMDDLEGRREYAFVERRPDLVRAGTPAWSWNQRWQLTPASMDALGYLALPDIDEPAYIRRDLVVRPATAAPSAGVHLDELSVPEAASGGPVIVRAWISAPVADRSGSIRTTISRAGAPAASAVSSTTTIGADVLDPDEWSEGEAVQHVARLTPPAGTGALRVRVDVVGTDGTTSPLADEQIVTGGGAVAAAADRVASTDTGGTSQAAITVLQRLDDLATAAPDQADAIEVQAEAVRSRGLDALRHELSADLADGASAADMETARRAIVAIRGRNAADRAWTDLAERFQRQAVGSDPEERYRLLAIAAAADPSSPSIQKDLLAARAARPSTTDDPVTS